VALAPGVRLGAYEIVGRIGAGGMGEVYRARDTRLNRMVAVKILPEQSATQPQFRDRFEREARAISSLEHPNICPLYDVGEHEGVFFLVMQHLEGETLELRLQKGPLPVEQAIQCAIEITDALDKAHRQGTVHRDLKPGNIMLTASGAKLLDFGLAKSGKAPFTDDLSMLPTTPPNITVEGAILGTFQYMSPEQLEGREADARSDIFSFGVVLYEMLSGKRPFEGGSQASLIAAILEHEHRPLLTDHPTIPRYLDHVVTRCLAKNPDSRWQSARDLCDELRWMIREAVEPVRGESRATARPMWRILAWAIGTVTIVAAAFTAFHMRPAAPAREMRLDVAIPMASDLGAFTLSPDGERMVAAASTQGERRLWLRSITSGAWRPLSGTEGAYSPFWSPDSRSVGFIAGNKLKRIDVDGGIPQVLGDASPRGGSWNRDGVILYAPNVLGPLARISAHGGEPVPVTKLEPLQTAHVSPFFLPDGRRFLYFAPGPVNTRALFLASLDSIDAKRLTAADSPAVYIAPEWLLYVNQNILRARRFNPDRRELSGEEFTVANGVSPFGGSLSASQTGLIGYRTEGMRQTQLMFADRSGQLIGPFGPPGAGVRPNPTTSSTAPLSAPRLSPDGKRAAMFGGEFGDIFLIDQARVNRFTFDTGGDRYPVWSPDGRHIVFDSRRGKSRDLYRSASPGGEELLLATDQDKTANDYSPDGRFILFQSNDQKTGIDLWVLPLTGKRQPNVFLRTPFNERRAAFSPDGRWVTYLSNESGRYEVYVRPFVDPDSSAMSAQAGASTSNWQISTQGGIQPRWSLDGNEVYYVNPEGKLMAVPIKFVGSTLEAGAPVALFSPKIVGVDSVDAGLQYDVSPDGRFVLNTVNDDPSPVTVIVNWKPPTVER
jgi:Tol biopolymer transport system component